MVCPKKKKNQKGQALLIVLLVSVIGISLGLTLASRTTEQTRMSADIDESSRAFSAAEAGLEESAQHIGELSFTSNPTLGAGGSYEVSIQPAGGTDQPYAFPGEIKNNQPITVWLVGHKTDGSGDIDWTVEYDNRWIAVCWGDPSQPTVQVGLEATLFYKKSTNPDKAITLPDLTQTYYAIAKAAYNQAIIANADDVNLVAPPDIDFCENKYLYQTTITFRDMAATSGYEFFFPRDTLIFLKLRPIVANGGTTKIAVIPKDNKVLPTQGEEHISVGVSAGGKKTKIVQFVSHPAPPELFDVLIYSKDALTK